MSLSSITCFLSELARPASTHAAPASQEKSLTWESPWLQESTKSVELLNESQRTASESGTLMYDLEYELDSTRGRKRFLSTVAVKNKKLYIVNGTFKCGEDLCNDARPAVKIMQAMLRSFDVTA